MNISSKLYSKSFLLFIPSIYFICGFFVFIINCKLIIAQKSSNKATSSISATITNPIGISKTNDMSIRNSALSTSSRIITIDPNKSSKIRKGRNFAISKSFVNPASFNVTGTDTYTYSITLPSSVYTSKSSLDAQTLLINNFTSLPTGSGILTSGTQTIFVGATVYFNAPLPTNKKNNDGDFMVIINYN